METLPKTSFLVRLSPSTLKSSDALQKFPELAHFARSKSGCKSSLKAFHNFFKKTIIHWSSYYTQRILSNDKTWFQDLINEGHTIVQKRLIDIHEALEKEQNEKNKTKKSWLENNINLWIRSYLKNYAEKIKKGSSIDISELEDTDNENFQSKQDKKDYVNECEIKYPTPADIYNCAKAKCNNSKIIKNAIKSLNPIETKVVDYLYFNSGDLKFSEKIKDLKNKLNVSDKRIYFIHSTIIKKLKKVIENKVDVFTR